MSPCGYKTEVEWLVGACSAIASPRASTASASKTRSKDAGLCYQAAEPETAEMVLEAGGEVGCLPESGEPSPRTALRYQAPPVNICKCVSRAQKPRTGSLDNLLRRRRNKIDLVVRGSHKKKEYVRAGDQKGGKMAQSLINTKENKNKSQEHLFTHLMGG